MRFLCLQQQQSFGQQSDQELVAQWQSWMDSAGEFYQKADWHSALTYAGSAFDLAKIRLGQGDSERMQAMAQITLSGIYLANILQHLGMICEARNTLLVAEECLQCMSCTGEADCANEMCACLKNRDLRDSLIGQFLHLPYKTVLGVFAENRLALSA